MNDEIERGEKSTLGPKNTSRIVNATRHKDLDQHPTATMNNNINKLSSTPRNFELTT